MRCIAPILTLLLGSLLLSAAHAQVCPRGYTVAFINGVNTDITDVGEHIAALSEALGDEFSGEPISYLPLENPTANVLEDLFESLSQMERQFTELEGRVDIFWGTVASVVTAVPSWMRPESLRTQSRDALLARIQAASMLSAADADRVSETMAGRVRRNVLDQDRKVLIVAHSQGNLFANAVMRQVLPAITAAARPNALRALHVAPPAPTWPEGSPVVVNTLDLVMMTLRALGIGPPPDGNVTVTLPEAEATLEGAVDLILLHGMSSTYLREGGEAREKIIRDGHDQLRALSLPCQQLPPPPPLLQLTNVQTDGCLWGSKTAPRDAANVYLVSQCDLVSGRNPQRLSQIFRVSVQTAEITQVTDFVDEHEVRDLAVSGDGSFLVFNSVEVVGAPGQVQRLRAIVAVRTDGTGKRLVSDYQIFGSDQLSISYDGSTVVYVSWHVSNAPDVYRVNIDGSETRRILVARAYPRATISKISDDGTRVALLSNDFLFGVEPNDLQLYTMSGDGEGLTKVLDLSQPFLWLGVPGHPALSEDGAYALVVLDRDLYRVPMNGGPRLRITNVPEGPCADDRLCTVSTSWLSPDGSIVVYALEGVPCAATYHCIIRRNVDGSGMTVVTQRAISGTPFVGVNRDASTVIFASSDNLTGSNPQGAMQLFAWRQ